MYRTLLWILLFSSTATGTPPIQVVVSKEATCTLHNDQIECFGRGSYGILAQENTNDLNQPPSTPIAFCDGFIPKSMDCGSFHCCSVSTVSSAVCWGEGQNGTLGQGNTQNIGDDFGEMGNNLTIIDLGTDFSVDHISCGGRHSCALSTNNELKCFGLNNYGQLGIGSTEDIGDEMDEMGDNLMAVDLGSDFVPIRVECGGYFTCVISSKFELKCFGRNDFGELGMGDINHRGDSIDEMGDNLHPIDLGTGFTVSSIRCGGHHICALSTTQSIKCFGSNKYGQLGLGDSVHRGDDPNEMGDYLETVDLGTDFVPQSVRTGGIYSLSVSTTGALKAWGYGARLGYGTADNRGDEPNEMDDFLPEVDLGSGFNVAGLDGGSLGDHTCVLVENGSISGLKCYGRNYYGQLGLADFENRGDGVDEMGDHLPFVDGYDYTHYPTAIPTANPIPGPTAMPSPEVTHSEMTHNEPPSISSTTISDDGSSVVENETNFIFVVIITVIGVLLILTCGLLIFYVRTQRKKFDGKRQRGHVMMSVMNSSTEHIVEDQMEGLGIDGVDYMGNHDEGLNTETDGILHPKEDTETDAEDAEDAEDSLYEIHHVVVGQNMVSRRGDDHDDVNVTPVAPMMTPKGDQQTETPAVDKSPTRTTPNPPAVSPKEHNVTPRNAGYGIWN